MEVVEDEQSMSVVDGRERQVAAAEGSASRHNDESQAGFGDSISTALAGSRKRGAGTHVPDSEGVFQDPQPARASDQQEVSDTSGQFV